MAEYDEVIPPGQEGSITLEIVGEKVSGRWSKSAAVVSNDPKHPQLTIALAGNELQYVDVRPNRVYLRGMYGENVTNEITVSSDEKKANLKILDVTSNIDDKITYEVVPDAEPGRYTIKLYKNPKLPTMNTWGSITIKTNSEHSPEKIVQINCVTRGAIVVQPSILNFGSVRSSQLATATTTNRVEKAVTVFKVTGDFHIRDVAFSSDYYEANVEPLEEGKKYKVTVSFQPQGDGKKSYSDEMIINTDDPKEPSIRVRLIARGV